MAGRLGVSLLTDWAGWRGAVAVVGVAGLVMAEAFRRLAPASRHFAPAVQTPRQVAHGFLSLFRDRAMPLLFVAAFVLMGVFVNLYNYAGFRLMAAPYSAPPCGGRRDLPAILARFSELGLVRQPWPWRFV